jgi:hypothetical protein
LTEITGKKKVIIGTFVLLAIVLTGYNGFKFMSLYDTPLTGSSLGARLASDKWNRLEDLLMNKESADLNVFLESFVQDTPSPELHSETAAQAVQDAQPALLPVPNDPELPVISGLMKTLNSEGKSRVAVFINNKLYYEHDVIEGFVIKKITDKGVNLTRGKRSWQIEPPEISYSVDRGN